MSDVFLRQLLKEKDTSKIEVLILCSSCLSKIMVGSLHPASNFCSRINGIAFDP
jgi:hypothetical protein